MFAEILPPERHITSKTHTIAIKRDNSNTRHYLGKFTRRIKVISCKESMIDLTLGKRLASPTGIEPVSHA